MSTTVYMKLLEQAPAKYDRGMRILTLGRIDRIKREIANEYVQPNDHVLEIGCGTGSLAKLLTDRGAKVLGIDVSDPMLAAARQNAPNAQFVHSTAVEIDDLGVLKFDRIVATLVFSELSVDEREYVLQASHGLLPADGTLIVVDEVVPARWWQRVIFYLVRCPLVALTWLLTQNTTHALRDFETQLTEAGYKVDPVKRYLFGTLALVVARRP